MKVARSPQLKPQVPTLIYLFCKMHRWAPRGAVRLTHLLCFGTLIELSQGCSIMPDIYKESTSYFLEDLAKKSFEWLEAAVDDDEASRIPGLSAAAFPPRRCRGGGPAFIKVG